MRSLPVIFLLFSTMMTGASADDFWQETTGPEGGNIFVVSVDGNGNIYAGTGGLYLSSDNGENWDILLYDKAVRSIAFGPGDEIYLGTESGEILFSDDSGSTWVNIEPDIGSRVASLLVTGSDTLLAGTGGEGLFRTLNNGTDWTQVDSGFEGDIVNSLVRSENSRYVFDGDDLASGVYFYRIKVAEKEQVRKMLLIR